MLKNLRLLLIFAAVVSLAVYAYRARSNVSQSKAMNAKLSEEKNQLQAYTVGVEAKIEELSASLEAKEKRLKELSDVQSIRNALTNAQEMIGSMSKELSKVNSERLALQNENLNTSNRLQNVTREYMKATEELKAAKNELAGVNRTPLKARVDELARDNDAKDEQIARLKKDIADLQSERQALAENSKALETRVALLQKEAGRQKSVALAQVPQEDRDEFKALLAGKENRIRELESQLAAELDLSKQQAGGGKNRSLETRLRLARQELSEKDSTIAMLASEKERLASELDRLKARKGAVSDTSAQYEDAKEQLRQISSLLVKKDLELDKVKKDSMDSAEKVFSLQSKLNDMHRNLEQTRANQEKLRGLDSQMLTLQSRLNESQGALNKKSELIDSLQRNLDYLNQQLAKKEDEKKSVESRLLQLDALKSNAQEELLKQKAHVAEVDLLYNSLRAQISQLSEVLSDRDRELDRRKQEVATLKGEIANLKTRSDKLEEELVSTSLRQKKTLDDLAAAVRLNAVLQERMSGVSGISSVSEPLAKDKENAYDLKRKIEVILEPEK